MVLALVAGLCFTCAALVRRVPQLARLGMLTLGLPAAFILVMVLPVPETYDNGHSDRGFYLVLVGFFFGVTVCLGSAFSSKCFPALSRIGMIILGILFGAFCLAATYYAALGG